MIYRMIYRLKIIHILATLLLIAGLIFPWAFTSAQQSTTIQAIELARTHLLSSQNPDGSIGDSSSSDWAAMALTAAATNDSRFSSLKTYVTAQASRVDKNSATELERTILALTAIGVTPYNIQNRNLVDELKALATGGQIGSPNLLNDDIFAILAFRAAGQDPTTEPFKSVIEFVKRNQLGSGGFNDRVGAQEADIDISAVAIVALNPYTATASAKSFLASSQNQDGGFPSRPGTNSNVASTSWAIWALGTSQRASDYLLKQQQTSGSFGSILTTSYGLHALTGRSLPVAVATAPVQPVTQPASQQQPAPTNQQPTQQPAPTRELQPQISPQITTDQGNKAPQPTIFEAKTTKPDVKPVTTPGVTKPSPKRTRATQKRVDEPLAAPVASVNRNSNLLLITSNTSPKETLAQTHFEAQTVEVPPIIQPKNKLSNALTYVLAIGAVTLVSILVIVLLWQSSRPTELIQPRLALS